MEVRYDWQGPVKAEPNFNNLLKVLRREKPDRPTLFEFFLNDSLYRHLAGDAATRLEATEPYGKMRLWMQAFRNAGYDYSTIRVPDFWFPTDEREQLATVSQNTGFVITDRASFDAYAWPDPAQAPYDMLAVLGRELPRGMKMIVCGPGGVLENVTSLLGYENLCYLIADDDGLVADVFEAVGSRLLNFYQRVLPFDGVGAIISNDDWGFKSQPMLAPEEIRRFVIPWHKQIVAAAHQAGKPVILHSCGNLTTLMDDIIDDIGYDGKHSYEDTIQPVEQAYEMYGRRIAILGGLDLDFVCRATPDAIYQRARGLLQLSEAKGGYALGTGNSVPKYVPFENYFAMLAAVNESR